MYGMTALKDSFLKLIESARNTRRRQKLAQMERDFRLIVERTQRERKPSVVTEIGHALQHTIDDVERRIRDRPADRKVILYDLSRSNRAARDAADQVKFTAVTLAIISQRAKELEQLLADQTTRPDSVDGQMRQFLDGLDPIDDTDASEHDQA